jgi:hypothetical protein
MAYGLGVTTGYTGYFSTACVSTLPRTITKEQVVDFAVDSQSASWSWCRASLLGS